VVEAAVVVMFGGGRLELVANSQVHLSASGWIGLAPCLTARVASCTTNFNSIDSVPPALTPENACVAIMAHLYAL